MKARIVPSRPWAEAAIALVLLLVTVAFALSILDSQAAYADDRASLMALKESWSTVAGGFGIRGDTRTTSADFASQYNSFRERPSVVRLLSRDGAFKAAAAAVDEAFARLEQAEYYGGAGSMAYVTKAVSNMDAALGAMAERIVGFSRERLRAAQFSLVILILLVIATAGIFMMLERRIMLESVEAAGNRSFAAALISAQEEERLRISHELHDAVAQDLAAARLYCDLAASAGAAPGGEAGGGGSGPSQGGDARKASTLLERAIGEIREICQGLRPVELDRLGVSQACGRLCAETSRLSGLEVSFSTKGFELIEGRELEILGEAIEINIYRILQEALTNVRRHAMARRVEVLLEYVPAAVRLKVSDDGVGLGSSRAGMGRRGMEERARMLGGLFSVSQTGTRGAMVSAAIPVPQREIQ